MIVTDYKDITFYKYRQVGKFCNDIIEDTRLYLCPWENLNDPQECLIRYNRGDVSYCGTTKMLKQKYPEELEINSTDAKVCSLSKDWNIPVLWALYADGGKGVVIGVKIRKLPNNCELYKVDYHTDYPTYRQPIDQRQILKALSRKSEAWRFEEEYRVISSDPDSKFLESIQIVEVVFGERTAKEEVRKIVKLVGEDTLITFFRVEPNINKYGLQKVEIQDIEAYLNDISC